MAHVIEGVLMKGKDLWGLAVRRPDGTIFRESWNNSSRIGRYPWKLPFSLSTVLNACRGRLSSTTKYSKASTLTKTPVSLTG